MNTLVDASRKKSDNLPHGYPSHNTCAYILSYFNTPLFSQPLTGFFFFLLFFPFFLCYSIIYFF